MYTTSNKTREAPLREKMLEHLEPLFVKNKVTHALWGHVHRYGKFCPMNSFTCGSKGLDGVDWEAFPAHIVIGMAGQDRQPIWEPRPDCPNDPIFPQTKRSLYRGSEFGYTRSVATKEKLQLSYVGNHDGEVHDMVEILASGQVLSGSGASAFDGAGARGKAAQSKSSLLVEGAIVLVFVAFVSYVLGFLSRSRKVATSKNSWTTVKMTEDV